MNDTKVKRRLNGESNEIYSFPNFSSLLSFCRFSSAETLISKRTGQIAFKT